MVWCRVLILCSLRLFRLRCSLRCPFWLLFMVSLLVGPVCRVRLLWSRRFIVVLRRPWFPFLRWLWSPGLLLLLRVRLRAVLRCLFVVIPVSLRLRSVVMSIMVLPILPVVMLVRRVFLLRVLLWWLWVVLILVRRLLVLRLRRVLRRRRCRLTFAFVCDVRGWGLNRYCSLFVSIASGWGTTVKPRVVVRGEGAGPGVLRDYCAGRGFSG